jgi:ABC-type lipoprotein export system ATPase subunit
LENRVPREPNQLSGGQQRGAIARTLVNRPALLLANEPTGSLDSRSGPEIRDILHQVHRNGETIVLITHIESVAISVAGGLIGVGTGIGPSYGFGVLVAKAMLDGGDWGTII